MDTRILLADDHAILRQGLRALLEKERGFVVVGEAVNGRAALEMIGTKSPQVVIMDVRMPDLNGIDATRQALQLSPDIRVIALSASADELSAMEMLRAGAMGYVLKDSAFDELVSAIHSVLDRKVYLSPQVAKGIVTQWVAGDRFDHNSVFDSLSPREREVLQLIAEGKATKEVAAQLHVSTKTVEAHRRNMMEKLKIDSVAGLTKYAVREGVTSP